MPKARAPAQRALASNISARASLNFFLSPFLHMTSFSCSSHSASMHVLCFQGQRSTSVVVAISNPRSNLPTNYVLSALIAAAHENWLHSIVFSSSLSFAQVLERALPPFPSFFHVASSVVRFSTHYLPLGSLVCAWVSSEVGDRLPANKSAVASSAGGYYNGRHHVASSSPLTLV